MIEILTKENYESDADIRYRAINGDSWIFSDIKCSGLMELEPNDDNTRWYEKSFGVPLDVTKPLHYTCTASIKFQIKSNTGDVFEYKNKVNMKLERKICGRQEDKISADDDVMFKLFSENNENIVCNSGAELYFYLQDYLKKRISILTKKEKIEEKIKNIEKDFPPEN